jgi:hypothetical protein
MKLSEKYKENLIKTISMYILKFKFKCLDPDMNGSFQKRSTLPQGRRKQVKVGGAQAFKALFHTKRAPSSKFIFG